MSDFVDRLPAGDRGAVEHLAFRERVLLDHRNVEGDVLPLAARIGEAEIRIFDVVVLDELQDVFGASSLSAVPLSRGPADAPAVLISQIASNAGFAGSDPDRFLYLGDENLSIADPAGLGGAADRIDGLVDHLVAQHDLDFHLRQEIDNIFGAAINSVCPFWRPNPLASVTVMP